MNHPDCLRISHADRSHRRIGIRSLVFGIFINLAAVLQSSAADPAAGAVMLRAAAFRADVTPALGDPLIWVTPATQIEDPLWAKGLILDDGHRRYVLCAIDWCGIGGSTNLQFRTAIARAAGTRLECVALQAVHQHTAPYIDGDGYRILAQLAFPPLMMPFASLARIVGGIADAVSRAAAHLEPVDRIGIGKAPVERAASARRIIREGKLITRYSTGASRPEMATLPEGEIDPFLRTVTLASANKVIARLHYYATHPQTFCCDGRISGDFVGAAREAFEKEDGAFQIYFTGCSGDVTVGKYNDATPEAREGLRDRLLRAMRAAASATTGYRAATPLRWRSARLRLPPPIGPDFSPEQLRRRLDGISSAGGQDSYRAAITLAFMERRRPVPATSLRLGDAWIVNLPGEPLLEFQRYALGLRPGQFVAVAGYGDISPGYLCTDRAFSEGGYEPGASNAGPGSEARVKGIIRKLMGR